MSFLSLLSKHRWGVISRSLGNSKATTLQSLHPSWMMASHSRIDRIPFVNLPSLYTLESIPSSKCNWGRTAYKGLGGGDGTSGEALTTLPTPTHDGMSTVMGSGGGGQLCKQAQLSWWRRQLFCLGNHVYNTGASRITSLSGPSPIPASEPTIDSLLQIRNCPWPRQTSPGSSSTLHT